MARSPIVARMAAKQRWLGLALAASIALATLLPFFATYGHVSAPSKLTSIFGEKILICTGDGFAWVKWSDLLAGKTPVKQDKKLLCPLCYLATHALGNILLPLGVALLLLYAATADAVFSTLPGRRRVAYANACSRAPPFSFIG